MDTIRICAASGYRTTRYIGTMAFALALTVGGARTAHAQVGDGFSANRFEPAERGSDWFSADSLNISGQFRPTIGVTGDYAHRSLVLYTQDGAPDYSVVKHRLDAHVGASAVAWRRVRFGISFPFALVNVGSDGLAAGTRYREPYRSPTIGDLRLSADARVFGEYGDRLRLAAGMRLWLPTGDVYSYAGDSNVRWSPQITVAGDVSRFIYSAKVHFLYRAQKVAFGNAAIGNEVGIGVALGARILRNKRLLIGPELNWATRASASAFGSKTTPAEVLFGAHYTHKDVSIGAGAGVGLTQSPGDPQFRILASFDWTPTSPSTAADARPTPAGVADQDHDGVPDTADRCPAQPGRITSDPASTGCPDSDGDGMADIVDACPQQVGTAGAHGCADTDVDGIADDADACKTVFGVASSDPQKNGCPPDGDGDGVADNVDACPLAAGPQREGPGAGCPDADSDGAPDPLDACPQVAGIPSLDPTRNGCPIAELTVERIAIREQVRFVLGKAEIDLAGETGQVLEAVWTILKEHPEVRLRIEGHTDNVGEVRANQALSAKRASAVRDWLIRRGIVPSRLISKGFGSTKPLGSNDTEPGRTQNRRVELLIDK
jgi:OmpA-OmpF porin, OOP family